MEKEQWGRFCNSVLMVYEQWTALRLVLEHQEQNEFTAKERIKELCEITDDLFHSKGNIGIDSYDLAYDLERFVKHYYEVDIEDGSYEEVSRHLCKIYEEISKGEVKEYNKLVESYSLRTRYQGESVVDVETSEECSEFEEEELLRDEVITEGDHITDQVESRGKNEVDDEGFHIYRRDKSKKIDVYHRSN